MRRLRTIGERLAAAGAGAAIALGAQWPGGAACPVTCAPNSGASLGGASLLRKSKIWSPKSVTLSNQASPCPSLREPQAPSQTNMKLCPA